MKSLALFLIFALIATSLAGSTNEWKSRTIYQVLTDRFARTNGDKTACRDLRSFCGGTFQGIINNLDYIKGMGFDAIWISPVVANFPGGYHGYWAKNLYEISPEFGGSDGLRKLIQACHSKGIWVMVDVVVNHMGAIKDYNFGSLYPFNKKEHYHNDVPCDFDVKNQHKMDQCWLYSLPDLDQDHQYVRKTLTSWISDLVKTYKIDGIRIDTVPYVKKDFWTEFTKAAGVYTIGEVFSFDFSYTSAYQGPLSSVLNYPLYIHLRNVFQQYQPMNQFESYFQAAKAFPDQHALGNFVNSHDVERFLAMHGDHVAFKSAIAFSFTTLGIPILYYGDEQAFGGLSDPGNREPLWTNMKAHSPIYDFIATINKFRKQVSLHALDQVQRYSDQHFYAFTRGKYFFAFTNSHDYQKRTITYHPYKDGTRLCNLFYSNDCVIVQNGRFDAVLVNGEVKIFLPQ